MLSAQNEHTEREDLKKIIVKALYGMKVMPITYCRHYE